MRRIVIPLICAGLTIGACAERPSSQTIDLPGTWWRLDSLGEAKVIEGSGPTLAFSADGRIAGNGSCNQFSGAVSINGSEITMGPIAATKRACLDEAVSNQETQYFAALETANRYEWQDPYLLIHGTGSQKPLRFVRQPK
jgi:heat shock protein HslJ